MRLTELSVDRPVTVTIGVFVAILLGAVSLSRLAIDLLPEFNFPIAAVATSYEGAGPAEVESLVTRPIEEVMTTASGATSISSISSRGSSVVLVEFSWGTDMNFATLELREKVDLVKPLLPDGAGDPRVLKFDPSASPILQFGMGGPYPLSQLKAIAEDIVKSRLERIEGVASVSIVGGTEEQVQVLIDPSLMRAYQISFDTVRQALQAANLNLPGGRISAGDREFTVRTTGEFESPEQIGEVRIPTPSGGVVRLSDVAEVRLAQSDLQQITRLNGEPSLGIEVLKETGSNTVQVARRVYEAVAALEAELGDIRFVTVADESQFIEDSIGSVQGNAVFGGLLAMAILYVFLRNLTVTAIIATSIPISIIVTFVLMYFSGMTLNMLSLGGLALGVGMLVDNAIVVLENIFRHHQLGSPPRKAAVEGTSEVGAAVIASTLTTVAVFVPVIFVQGFASQLFRDLSLAVSFSLAASLSVALTLIPLLASRWIKSAHAGMPVADGAVDPSLYAGRVLKVVYAVYERLIRATLRHKALVLSGAAVIFVGSLYFATSISREFIPNFDVGQVQVEVELPRGSSLEATDRAVRAVEEYVAGLPYIDSVFASAGTEDAPDVGNLTILLVPRSERRLSTAEAAEAIRDRFRDFTGAQIRVSAVSGMPGGGLSGAPVQVELRGDDMSVLEQTAGRVAELIRRIPGTRDITTSLEATRPELQVRVNRRRATDYGVSVAQIASAVRTAIEGTTATILRTGNEEIDVVVRLPESRRRNIADLLQVPISTPFGVIPLSEVADVEEAESPLSIQRTDQVRVVAVYAHVAGRVIGDVMDDIRREMARFDLPPGVEVQYGGDDEFMRDAFDDPGFALILSVILVYAVLAAQFESFIHPLAIMFSVPFALVGVVWSLYFTGHTLNAASIIGVILLVGVVVNNSIVLVDFVNQLRARGESLVSAVVLAGKTRLRPILMMTSTTVLGMIPLALGIGEGSEVQAPMAVVVVGGLSFSTVLTLLVVPTAYAALDSLTSRLRRVKNKPQEVV